MMCGDISIELMLGTRNYALIYWRNAVVILLCNS